MSLLFLKKEMNTDHKLESFEAERTDQKLDSEAFLFHQFTQKSNLKRRRHKNTRLGCEECKHRKIKCDNTLKFVVGGFYTCLNCILKWKRINMMREKRLAQHPNEMMHIGELTEFKDICSFSHYSLEDIAKLKQEVYETSLSHYEEMHSQRLYPIRKIQHCSNEVEEFYPDKIEIQKVFEVTMIPHENVVIQPPNTEIKMPENSQEFFSNITLSRICISAMNYVNEETCDFYTLFALNAYVSKLKKMYNSELKGMDAIYGAKKLLTNCGNDSELSFACFDQNRYVFEENLNFLNVTSTFEAKKTMIFEYIKEAEQFLRVKVNLSYNAIKKLLVRITTKSEYLSPDLYLNCYIGVYLLKNFELYRIATDDFAMKRYVEHCCSSFEISWQLIHLNDFHKRNLNISYSNISMNTKNNTSLNFNCNIFGNNQESKFDSNDLVSENECNYSAEKVGLFELSNTIFNQQQLHMSRYSISFLREVMRVLNEFGNTFILSVPVNQVDLVLKEDFSNLVLFLEELMNITPFADKAQALALQPNLLLKITHKLLAIKPKNLLLSAENKNMNKERLAQLLQKFQISNESFVKYSHKDIVKAYNEEGLISPVQKVLYGFYFLINIALTNCFPEKLYAYENECYGKSLWNSFSFNALIKDFDESKNIDRKLLFFANYSYRVTAFLYKRKAQMTKYCCLNTFYESNETNEDHKQRLVKESSELFLPQPCYKSREAYNIKETPIENFLTTRLIVDNYFSIDDSKPIPLEIIIGFENCYQRFQKHSLKGPNVSKNGHYWDGHFYLILIERYAQYKNNLQELLGKYRNIMEFFFTSFKQIKNTNVAFKSFIKSLDNYDINKLALKNISGTYKFQEQLIQEKELDDIEISLQNLCIVYRTFNACNNFFQTGEQSISQLTLKLNHTASPLVNSSNVTNRFCSSSTTASVDDNVGSLKTNALGSAVLRQHQNLKLSLFTGLFPSDYDPILGTISKNYESFALDSLLQNDGFNFETDFLNREQKTNLYAIKERSMDGIGLLMPNSDFIKMVRRDKVTLLLTDGRDVLDK